MLIIYVFLYFVIYGFLFIILVVLILTASRLSLKCNYYDFWTYYYFCSKCRILYLSHL